MMATLVSFAGYLAGIAYPVVVWLLVFAVISFVVCIPLPSSAMDEHPLLISTVSIFLTVVVMTTPRDTLVSLAGYLPGILYTLLVWLLVFAAISIIVSLPLSSAMDEHPLLISSVSIFLTVVVMRTPMDTIFGLPGYLAGIAYPVLVYLPGVVYPLVVWLLVFAAISIVISLPLPSAMDEHPLLTFTVTIFLTVVVMRTPLDTIFGLPGYLAGILYPVLVYLPGIMYPLVVWLLVFAVISSIITLPLPSARGEHTFLTFTVTIFLTVVVMRTPLDTIFGLAGYLAGIVYPVLVWLLVFAVINSVISLLLPSARDEHTFLTFTVTIFLTVVVMRTSLDTIFGLPGYLAGIVYPVLLWLLVFAAISVATNIVYPLLPLPPATDKYPLLTFTVTISLTVVLMRTPWDTILGLPDYLLETAYLLLLWFLVFLAISAVVSILVPSAIKKYPNLAVQFTIGLTVVLRIPALGGTALDIVYLLLVWFLLFYSVGAVVCRILVLSAAKKRPMFTFVFVVGLTLVAMRVLWGWGTIVQLPARISVAPTNLPLDELVLDDFVRFPAEFREMDLISRDTEETRMEHKRDMEKIISLGSNLLAEEIKDLKHDVLYQGAIQRLVIYTVTTLIITMCCMIIGFTENAYAELINRCVFKGNALAKDALGSFRWHILRYASRISKWK